MVCVNEVWWRPFPTNLQPPTHSLLVENDVSSTRIIRFVARWTDCSSKSHHHHHHQHHHHHHHLASLWKHYLHRKYALTEGTLHTNWKLRMKNNNLTIELYISCRVSHSVQGAVCRRRERFCLGSESQSWSPARPPARKTNASRGACARGACVWRGPEAFKRKVPHGMRDANKTRTYSVRIDGTAAVVVHFVGNEVCNK